MATNYRSLIKTVSFNKKTEQEVLDFVNAQENFSDTVLFLIQKEICTNGISNLQQFIPSARTIADVQRLITQGNNSQPISIAPVAAFEEASSSIPESSAYTIPESISDSESIADEEVESDGLDEIPPELMI